LRGQIRKIPSLEDDLSEDPFERINTTNELLVYHGTSSNYSDQIEAEGLDASRASILWESDARRLHAVLEEMDCASEGAAILKYFTFGMGVSAGRKHTYLAETFQRATNYAISGGETYQALRLGIDTLKRYAEESEVRRQSIQRIEHVLRLMNFHPFDANGPSEETIPERIRVLEEKRRAMHLLTQPEWIRAQLASFQELDERLKAFAYTHTPVVYAAPASALKSQIVAHSSMGVEIRGTIPSTCFIGRTIPSKRRQQRRHQTTDQMTRFMHRLNLLLAEK
jgi:hypothetical protein